jgi:CheY-like chemotaxis protein
MLEKGAQELTNGPVHLKTFALADDDSDDTGLFTEALQEINPEITVETASNGQELLDKMKGGDFVFPDIIFLDINMPEMNGWDCLRELKKDSELKEVPVVMYSTSSHIDDKTKAVQLGASYFYTKPDSFQELKKFLSTLIRDPGRVITS